MIKSFKFKLILIVFLSLFLILGIFCNVLAATCEDAKGTCRSLNLEGGDTCQAKETESKDTCGTGSVCCVASAAKPPTVDKTEATKVGYAKLNILQLGDNPVPVLMGRIVKAILGITGAIALLMVVYGAITLLISRGGEGVKKGKDILIWAAIGSMVVVGSYVLVDYAIKGLSGQGGGATDSTKDKECSALHPKAFACAKEESKCESIEFAGAKYIEDKNALFCNNDNVLKCCYPENENECYVKYPGNSACSTLSTCPEHLPNQDKDATCPGMTNAICCYK